MIVLLDSYDSFVWNLRRYLDDEGVPTRVVRSDAVTVAEVAAVASGLLLSPGPKTPADAGICVDAVTQLSGRIPILGVCLGHQAIVAAFGGRVRRAGRPRHGMASPVTHDGTGLFAGLPGPLTVGRYHSLVADPDPAGPLRVTARSLDDDEVMAVAHTTHPTWGVQFHPESVLTPQGRALVRAFVARVSAASAAPGRAPTGSGRP